MSETFTATMALSKFSQGDNPPVLTAAKLNANLDKIDLEIFNRLKKDGSTPFTGPQSMGGFKLTNNADPLSPQDLVTLAYFNLKDRFAASRIVDPSGSGTDTTIAAAVAALPSIGGDIYIKGGSYAIPSSIDFGAKIVRLRGAGTTINFATSPTILIPASGITVFKNGGAGTTIEDLTVEGNSTSAQVLYKGDSDVRFLRVNIHSVAGIIGPSPSGFQQTEILFRDSYINVPGAAPLADQFLWKGSNTGGTLVFDNVEMFVATSGATLMSGFGATDPGPSFKVVNSYTGGGGGGGSTNFYYTQVLDWVGFDIDNAQFEVNAARNFLSNCGFMDFSIKFKGTWNFISNCNFSGGGTGGALFTGQVTFVNSNESTVTGCNFYGNFVSFRGIEVLNAQLVQISGCLFTNHASAGVLLGAGTSPQISKASVVGCTFSSAANSILEGDVNPIGWYEGNFGVDSAFGGFTDIKSTKSTVNNENIRTVAINTTVNAGHRTLLVDASGGSRTMALPAPLAAIHMIFEFKKKDASANTVVIAAGAFTIDGASSQTLIAQYDKIRIQSDGAAWWII